MNAEAPSFDPVRILEALHRHGVEYLVVGGVAGQAHGATRATNDLDCVPRSTKENLQRLAVAMRELDARLRVEGMSDDEARQLPVQLDSDMLDRLRVSSWITNAGLFDVLMDIPDRQGGRRDYADLAARSATRRLPEFERTVAALDTWHRWANGHTATVEQLHDTVEVLTAARGTEHSEQHRVLGHVIQTWAGTAGIDLHIADRRPPAISAPESSSGCERTATRVLNLAPTSIDGDPTGG